MAAEAWVTSIKWSTAKLARCEWHRMPFQRFNSGRCGSGDSLDAEKIQIPEGFDQPSWRSSWEFPNRSSVSPQGGLCMHRRIRTRPVVRFGDGAATDVFHSPCLVLEGMQ